MNFEDAKRIILSDKKLNDNFRPNDSKYNRYNKYQNNVSVIVYFFGEKIIEICDETKKIIIPQGIFNITGEPSKLNKFGDKYIENVFTYDGENLIESLEPFVSAKLLSFTIEHGKKGVLTQEDISIANKLGYKKLAENKYKVNVEGLKNCIEEELKIVSALSSVGNMRKPKLIKEDYLLQYDKLDEVRLKVVLESLEKEVILHAINIGGQREKIFQEKLLSNYSDPINKAIKNNWDSVELLPLEEELNINRDDAEFVGRIDNLYIDKNTNSVIFAEVKYDNGVIVTKEKSPGLYKHAKDLKHFLNDNLQVDILQKQLKSRLNKSKTLGKVRVKKVNVDKLNIKDNKFIMICGYIEKSKKRVLNAIIREIDKFANDNSLSDLNMALIITELYDSILQDPIKNKDAGLKKINVFELNPDTITDLKEKIKELY